MTEINKLLFWNAVTWYLIGGITLGLAMVIGEKLIEWKWSKR